MFNCPASVKTVQLALMQRAFFLCRADGFLLCEVTSHLKCCSVRRLSTFLSQLSLLELPVSDERLHFSSGSNAFGRSSSRGIVIGGGWGGLYPNRKQDDVRLRAIQTCICSMTLLKEMMRLLQGGQISQRYQTCGCGDQGRAPNSRNPANTSGFELSK